jgi:peptidoglycan hydrolase-like protein with peptidoglycan-binding domain
MGYPARMVGFSMIIKVVAIAFLVLILGRALVDPFIKEKKSSPEEYYLGFDSDKKTSIQELQQILKGEGFYKGQIDGFLGEETRSALKTLQKNNRLKSDGKVDPRTSELLKELKAKQAQAAKDHSEANALLIDPAIYPDQEIVWDMDSWEGAMNVQKALKNGGYYDGKIDGKVGPRTKKAIKAFQRSKKLKADGVVGRKTVDQLKPLLSEGTGDDHDR